MEGDRGLIISFVVGLVIGVLLAGLIFAIVYFATIPDMRCEEAPLIRIVTVVPR